MMGWTTTQREAVYDRVWSVWSGAVGYGYVAERLQEGNVRLLTTCGLQPVGVGWLYNMYVVGMFGLCMYTKTTRSRDWKMPCYSHGIKHHTMPITERTCQKSYGKASLDIMLPPIQVKWPVTTPQRQSLSCNTNGMMSTVGYTVPSTTRSPAIAKLRVNLDLFPGPLPTPSPARVAQSVGRSPAIADGSAGYRAGCPTNGTVPSFPSRQELGGVSKRDRRTRGQRSGGHGQI